MREIPETFKKNGFEYKLLKRVAGIALYEQLIEGCVYGYEVHKVRQRAERTSKYKESDGTYVVVNYPEREVLASNVEFGYFGWSCKTIEKAEELIKGFN